MINIFDTLKNQSIPEIELAQDVLQILNIFVAKVNGLRKYTKICRKRRNPTWS